MKNKSFMKIGIGTASLVVVIIGALFSFSFGRNISLGDSILTSLGFKAWSNVTTGIHYTIFYSLIFYILALIMSLKFKDDIGSKFGRIISIVFIVFTLFSLLLIMN